MKLRAWDKIKKRMVFPVAGKGWVEEYKAINQGWFRLWHDGAWEIGYKSEEIAYEGEWLIDEEKVTNKDGCLMRFTELQDTKGQDIYEGDIVMAKERNPFDYANETPAVPWKAVVVFDKGGFVLEDRGVRTVNTIGYYDVEVIGNVYEGEK